LGRNVLFPLGTLESCRFTEGFLQNSGFLLTDHPSPDITHLLLDVPSFRAGGTFRDNMELKELLRMLPKTVTIVGGNLDTDYLENYRKIDLLKDQQFLAKNAAITAECALQAAAPYLTSTFADSPALILGWGRIGKCLAKLLAGMGCQVTVAARKESDRSLLDALGYRSAEFFGIEKQIPEYRLLFNTVPRGIVLEGRFDSCVMLDLASLPGLQAPNVIAARGLPGKYAPESAGRLIAQTICRLDKEDIK